MQKWSNHAFNIYIINGVEPFRNRKIRYFKEGHNIFNCPMCRTEYTRDSFDDYKIKKIVAKVHSIYNDERYVHYLTDIMDVSGYIPLSELGENGRIGDKWAVYIGLIGKIIEKKGDIDLYPAKRLTPHPEFILKSNSVNYKPLDKNGKRTEDAFTITDYQFELIKIKDLSKVLNDV
jgi:hypothetical protein